MGSVISRFAISWLLFGTICSDRLLASAQTPPTCPIGEDSAVELQLRFRVRPADTGFFSPTNEVQTNELLDAIRGALFGSLQSATAGGVCQNAGEIGRIQVQQISSLSLVTNPALEEDPTIAGTTTALSDDIHLLAKVEAICHECNLLTYEEIENLSLFGQQPLRRKRRTEEFTFVDLMDVTLESAQQREDGLKGKHATSVYMRQRHMLEFVNVGSIPSSCYCDPFVEQASVVQIFNNGLLQAEAGLASILDTTESSPLIEVVSVSELRSAASSLCNPRGSYGIFESYVLLTVDFLFSNSMADIEGDLQQGLLQAYNDVTIVRNDDDKVCDPHFRMATEVEIIGQEGAEGDQSFPGVEVVLTARITGICRDCDEATNLLYSGSVDETEYSQPLIPENLGATQ